MQSRQFWDEINDNCKVGSSYIKRIIDLERVPFNANLVFPDSNPEIIKELSVQVGLQHFARGNLDLLLSFHSFLLQTTKYNILVETTGSASITLTEDNILGGINVISKIVDELIIVRFIQPLFNEK